MLGDSPPARGMTGLGYILIIMTQFLSGMTMPKKRYAFNAPWPAVVSLTAGRRRLRFAHKRESPSSVAVGAQ
jgi:hypothetical protein